MKEKKSKDKSRVSNRISTGIEGLDTILGGGFPCHHFYLIEGDSGTGKTTLALQFLLEGKQRGENVLYIGLSENKAELDEVAASHGWSLDGIAIYELRAIEDSSRPENQYTVFHPADVELSKATEQVSDQVERLQPTRVVLDPLSELRLLAVDSLPYRRQILAFKQFFAGRRCTVLMVYDFNGHGGSQLRSIAHGVVQLERLNADYGAARRRLEVVKMRGVQFSGGYHDFVIVRGGIKVFPRLIAAEYQKEYKQEAVQSGMPELDQLLGGGIDRGTSTLVMGAAGSGKSTLATQYAVACADRGEHVVCYIFEESRNTFLIRGTGLGMNLESHVKTGRIVVQQVDPGELTPGEFAYQVRDAVEHRQARVVVIDSLNGYLNAMPNERALLIQMHELLTYLNQQGVLTLLVLAQHGIVGDPVQVLIEMSYLADTIILLRYFEASGAVKRAISVVKKRTGSHESIIREYRIGTKGLHLGQPLHEFHGVLTGVPTYTGKPGYLFEKESDT